MDAARKLWLALRQEPALDPDQPVCDPHHHLWVHRGQYLLREFLDDTSSGHNVVSTVFVACDAMYRQTGPEELRPVGETEFVEGIAREAEREAARTAVAAGIVGYADLTLGAAVKPILEAHIAASPARFRGIRHSVTWDPNPQVKNAAPHRRRGVMAEPGFRAGVACLAQLGLSFDAWLFHHQLPEIVALANAFPGLTFIINHFGGPLGEGPYAGKRADVFAVWKRGIEAAATCQNVMMKMGGFGMQRAGFDWPSKAKPPSSAELADAMRPYFAHCLEHFGARRCMFESNFPVDKESFSYTIAWNAFKRLVQDMSDDERDALLCANAMRAYRLPPRPAGG
jgi:L-fuconolactonase